MDTIELLNKFEDVYETYGYIIIFITSFIESSPFGWMTPGGFVLAGGGFYAFDNSVNLFLVILSGMAGTWGAICAAYYLGMKIDRKKINKKHQRKRFLSAKKIVEKGGGVILITSLTSNVTRFWVSLAAGARRYHSKKFLLYSFVSSAFWVLLWTFSGYFVGGERKNFEKAIARLQITTWLLLGIALLAFAWAYKKEHEDTWNRDQL